MNNSAKTTLSISRLSAFQDNYLWLIDNGEKAIAIDPGDAAVINKKLQDDNLKLCCILITHHHQDHTGGLKHLIDEWNPEIIGPMSKNIPEIKVTVRDGEVFNQMGITFEVIEVPGHTLDHIAYFISNNEEIDDPLLFCGDTLFAGGCGRVFEGTYSQMRKSLEKIRKLPRNTKIFCAHEYTEKNLSFAINVDPNNELLIERLKTVKEKRKTNQPTVPSYLYEEISTNPFLRYDESDIIKSAQFISKNTDTDPDMIFGIIRKWKDNFI